MHYNPQIVIKWFAEHGLYAVPEHRFDETRKWRFDFAFSLVDLTRPHSQWMPEHWVELAKLALEVEGGVWTGGRHTRASGFVRDMEKYNRAAVLGWRVLRTTPQELCMQETVDMVKEALGTKETVL